MLNKLFAFLIIALVSISLSNSASAQTAKSPKLEVATTTGASCTLNCKYTGLLPRTWGWVSNNTNCPDGQACTGPKGGCACACTEKNTSCHGEVCKGTCFKLPVSELGNVTLQSSTTEPSF